MDGFDLTLAPPCHLWLAVTGMDASGAFPVVFFLVCFVFFVLRAKSLSPTHASTTSLTPAALQPPSALALHVDYQPWYSPVWKPVEPSVILRADDTLGERWKTLKTTNGVPGEAWPPWEQNMFVHFLFFSPKQMLLSVTVQSRPPPVFVHMAQDTTYAG